MDDLVKADVFFFVTTIAVAILTILGTIVAAYLIIILRDVREIARTARRETEEIAEDFDVLRENVMEGVDRARDGVGGIVSFLSTLATALMHARRTRKRRTRSKSE